MKTYLYHNLGMGDHIICNAIVRHFAQELGLIHLFAKHHNSDSVKFMFRDIDVNVVCVADDREVEEIIEKGNADKVIRIGCTGDGWVSDRNQTFDEVFYKQAGIDFKYRWDGFKYDIKETKPHERMYCGKSLDFIFVHDDKDRGFKIDESYLAEREFIITPERPKTSNMMMWDRFLSVSKEIHCINSAFLLLADSIPTTGKLFYHKYARNEGWFCNPRLRKAWEVIE